jgi:hypothetical protein
MPWQTSPRFVTATHQHRLEGATIASFVIESARAARHLMVGRTRETVGNRSTPMETRKSCRVSGLLEWTL